MRVTAFIAAVLVARAAIVSPAAAQYHRGEQVAIDRDHTRYGDRRIYRTARHRPAYRSGFYRARPVYRGYYRQRPVYRGYYRARPVYRNAYRVRPVYRGYGPRVPRWSRR